MELGPEDVSLLERCPHFRGCYVQASMELGPEDVSRFWGCIYSTGVVRAHTCMHTHTCTMSGVYMYVYTNVDLG